MNFCQYQCTLSNWLNDCFYKYENIIIKTHKYCDCTNFYFLSRSKIGLRNTIIMIIKHQEIYSVNN